MFFMETFDDWGGGGSYQYLNGMCLIYMYVFLGSAQLLGRAGQNPLNRI